MVPAAGVFAQQPIVLRLEPNQINWQAGQSYVLQVKIDTNGECVNTARVDISFPADRVKIIDFSSGKSIISLWIKKPGNSDIKAANDSGTLSFRGGIPGGFCGENAGSLEENNILGEIIFKAAGIMVGGDTGLVAPSTEIKLLDSSQIYLNDGQGTLAQTIFQNAEFMSATSTESQDPNQWAQALRNDNIAPEQFNIKINKDDFFYDGKYFITFLTGDKQTGIDRFEISETPLSRPGIDRWKTGTSPYVLEDQSLRSRIKVKAVDKAGNETISEYLPEITGENIYKQQAALILLGILLGAAILAYSIKRIRHRND